jgi:hypothetical protein
MIVPILISVENIFIVELILETKGFVNIVAKSFIYLGGALINVVPNLVPRLIEMAHLLLSGRVVNLKRFVRHVVKNLKHIPIRQNFALAHVGTKTRGLVRLKLEAKIHNGMEAVLLSHIQRCLTMSIDA